MKEFYTELKAPLVKSALVLVFIFNIFTMCSVSTAHLGDVMVCATVNGSGECEADKTEFPAPVPVIYCSATLKNAPSDTKVIFTWKKGDEVLGKADVKSGSGVVYSNYNSPGNLEPGKYSVTVKIDTDNSDPVTKTFTIE